MSKTRAQQTWDYANRSRTAQAVANHKAANPDLYCPYKHCLWRTNGGYCPRHYRKNPEVSGNDEQNLAEERAS